MAGEPINVLDVTSTVGKQEAPRVAYNEILLWTVALYAERTHKDEVQVGIGARLLHEPRTRAMAFLEAARLIHEAYPESQGWGEYRVAITWHVFQVGGMGPLYTGYTQ